MKKFSLLQSVLFLLCLVISASAQVQLRLGVLGGLNVANISLDPKPQGSDFSSRPGFGGGGILELGVNENVALYGVGMLLQKGAKQEGSTQGVNFKSRTKLLYLEVPMMLKLTLGRELAARPYVMAGPTIGLLLSAKSSLKATGQGLSIDQENDIKDELKDIDLGAGVGAGLSLPVGYFSAFLEGRYVLGLSNFNDAASEEAPKAKNKGILIMAGVTIALGQHSK